MEKKKFCLVLLFVGLLVIALTVIYISFKRQEQLTQRHDLLCEVLKPGMSEDDVLRILEQTGRISVVGANSPGSDFDIHVAFTDPKNKEIYGAFELSFANNQYVGAHVNYFEIPDVICDFYNPKTTATKNP